MSNFNLRNMKTREELYEECRSYGFPVSRYDNEELLKLYLKVAEDEMEILKKTEENKQANDSNDNKFFTYL